MAQRDSRGRFVSSGGVGPKLKPKYTGPDGMRDFQKDLKEWSEKTMIGRLQQAVTDAAAVVLQGAIHRCPVGSGDNRGNLRRSLTMTEAKIQGSRVFALVGTDVEYGIYVEFGTKRLDVGTPDSPRTDWPAKHEGGVNEPERMPYLRSSIYANRQKIEKALKGGFIG